MKGRDLSCLSGLLACETSRYLGRAGHSALRSAPLTFPSCLGKHCLLSLARLCAPAPLLIAECHAQPTSLRSINIPPELITASRRACHF